MRTHTLRYAGAVLAASVVLASGGCGAETGPDDAQPEDTMSGTPTPSEPATSQPPAVQAAVADLAATLDVAPGDIGVVRVEDVTWRDGSLGCAQPGMSYTQALVEGQRIVLAAQGTEYEYHSGGTGDPFHCAKPTQ